MRHKPKIGDYLVFAFIALSAVFLMLAMNRPDTGEKTAVIIQDGSVLKTIRLDTLNGKVTIDYPGRYPGKIEAERGRIRFTEATCPDKVCVSTGWISRIGQIAVCLPNRTIIRIEGTAQGGDTDILLH